jgi:protein-disulfide isomerase
MRKWFATCFFVIALVCGCERIGYGQNDNHTYNRDEVVAVVNGQRITLKELDDLSGPELYNLQEKIYNLRKRALNNLITKSLIEAEAKVRGVTTEQLRKQLMPETVEVKQSEIEEIYNLNANRFANLSEEEAKQRIKLDLENRAKFDAFQASLARIRDKSKVEVLLQEPAVPIVKVSDSGPSKGSENAPVTIIEFSDFQCPYCKQASSTLRQVVESYAGDVKLVFKHLPLPIHQHAFKAAQAAVCAGQQGKFWEYHDLLFESSSDLSAEAFNRFAVQLGLKTTEFKSCLDSEFSRNAVMRDLQEARQSGIQSTPIFVVNGKVLRGARSSEEFKMAIDQELKKKTSAKTNQIQTKTTQIQTRREEQ